MSLFFYGYGIWIPVLFVVSLSRLILQLSQSRQPTCTASVSDIFLLFQCHATSSAPHSSGSVIIMHFLPCSPNSVQGDVCVLSKSFNEMSTVYLS